MGFEKELKKLIVDVYENFINSENDATQSDYTNRHRASSTGFCHRKKYYSFLDTTPTEPIKVETNRIFRLGNLFHVELQEAFTKHIEKNNNASE